MRGMLTKYVTACLGLALALCLVGPCPAQADTILQFSDVSSDETLASVLTAIVTFEVSGNQLLIDIDNQSNYQIAQLYFNTDDTLTGLVFSNSPNPEWAISGTGEFQGEQADGFGLFNWLIDFGSGDSRLGASPPTTSLTLDMTGTTSEATIGSKWSTIPPGEIQALAAMKFEAGPAGDSAFGAVVPIPGSWVLLASGLLGLVAIKRKKARG